MSLWPQPDQGLRGSVAYGVDLFEAATIRRLVGHFQTLLAGIAADPGQPVCELPILTASERQQLLVEWNDTRTDYPGEPTLADLFEAQVAKTPEAEAVRFEGDSLTYGELDRLRQPTGALPAEAGRRPRRAGGDLHRAFAGNGRRTVRRAQGGRRLSSDRPGLSPAAVGADVRSESREVLLVQEHLREVASGYDGRTVFLDSQRDEIAQEPDHAPPRPAGAEHLAYIIFTSGSTGEPKGVMVPHAGICNRLLWMQRAYALDAADRVLQKTPFSFDVSVWEFFWPLQVGATPGGGPTGRPPGPGVPCRR